MRKPPRSWYQTLARLGLKLGPVKPAIPKPRRTGLEALEPRHLMTVVNVASASNYVDEGLGASFTVTLSEPHNSDVVVLYRTESGSATASVDYQAIGEPSYEAPGSVFISAGSTSATIVVPTAQDSINEDDETFSLTIVEAVDSSSASLSIGTSAAGIAIADDDSAGNEISLSISDALTVEGGVASFTISLSEAATQDVSVWYETADGTASSSDYTSASSVAVISAGATSVTIAIPTTGDAIDESDETFSLSVTQAIYADATSVAIGDGVGIGTILDDDSPTSEISVSVSDVQVGEGDQASFTISLTSAANEDVSVWFSTHHGTAMGSDYTSSSGYAVISAGALTATVAIPTTDDSLDEADETFSLSLTQASYAGSSHVPIAVATGIATIVDNDDTAELTVSVDDASAVEGSSLQFILRLSAPASQDVWVWYSTVHGTATAADYNGSSGIAILSAGQTTTAVEISTIDDTLDEPNEVFSLTITQVAYPNNVALGISDGSGRGTIVDNDEPPSNDPPVAGADAFELDEDETLIVPAPGLLANDFDPNGSPLTAVLVSGVSHGTLTIGANGSFSYVPNANYHGVDTFTYRANDGQSLSSLVTVTLTILASDDAPVAAGDVYWLEEDGILSVLAPGILANDFDVEGDTLTVSEVTPPAHGSITWNAVGAFTYTPDPNFFGFDSFTYRASDGSNLSPGMTVILYVASVNDVPAGQPDAFELNEDTGLFVAAPGVLANDQDFDGRPLTASVVDEPLHGLLTLNADGSFNYVPEHDYFGNDTFTYRISNGFLDSPPITVHLTVHEYRQEIEIDESGVVLIDGLTTLDFGSTLPGSPVSRTFTLRNLGTAPLTIAAGSLSVPSGFALTPALPASILPGDSAGFTLTLIAVAAGNYGGSISIVSGDEDESPFSFAVGGVVLGSEIGVETENGTSILDGSGILNLGTTSPGNPVVRTLTIRNSGSTSLTLDPESIEVPAGFTVVTPFASTVAAGQATSLVLKLNASAVGEFSGTVSFATNDPDEEVFNLAITGVVSGAVVASVQNLALTADTGLSRSDRVTKDARVTGTVEGIFLGNVTVEFDHDGDNTKEGSVSVYVPGSSFTYNPAYFDPALLTYEGEVALQYRVVQRDAHGNLLAISNWSAFAPFWLEHPQEAEITVKDEQLNEIVAGLSFVNFGTVDLNQSVSRTFTIHNHGLGNLLIDLQSLSVPAGFSVVTLPAPSIAPRATSDFVVQLNATGVGAFGGPVSFFTNDENEHQFGFQVIGVVEHRRPEIAIRNQIGRAIADQGAFAFGATIVGQPIDRTFTVLNTGNANLVLDLAATVFPSGFSFLQPPASTVLPGQHTSFTVRFAADAIGSGGGVFSLSSNDEDEGTFEISLSASVVGQGVSSIAIDGPRLLNDNGSSSDDNISDDIRITGIVNGYFAGGSVLVEFDHDPDPQSPGTGSADGSVLVGTSGSAFVYDPVSVDGSLGQLNGAKTFRFRTIHRDSNNVILSTSDWSDFTFERTPPVGAGQFTIQALGLQHDTGLSSTDRVTINPAIYAVVRGEFDSNSATIQFDHDADQVADGSLEYEGNGTELYYDPRAVDSAFKPSSSPYQLRYRLVALSAAGGIEDVGPWRIFTLTFEAPPASQATVGSILVAAGEKEYEPPTITGTVLLNGTPVVASAIDWDLDEDGVADGTAASTSGGFSITPALVGGYGAKTVRLRAKAWSESYGTYLVSGSWIDVSFVWSPIGAPEVSDLKLAVNTGATNDTSSLDPTIAGKVSSGQAGVKVYLDFDSDGTADAYTVTDEGGTFTHRQLGLPIGLQTVTVWAARYDLIDDEEIFGTSSEFTFALEANTLPPIAGLKLIKDDGASATDRITTSPAVVGRISETTTQATDVDYEVVSTAAPSVVIASGRTSVDSTGAFTFTPVDLATGASYIVRARSVRWNALAGGYAYGNWSNPTLDFTLEAAVHVPAHLTGLSLVKTPNAAGETTDPAVQGSVKLSSSSSAPASFMVVEVAVDTPSGTEPTPQAQVVADADGKFLFVPIGLANGAHVLHFRTREWNYTNRTTHFGPWQSFSLNLISQTTTAPSVGSLSLHSDTGVSQTDLVTANPLLVGQITNFLAGKTVVEIDLDGVLDGSGNKTAETLAYPNDQGQFLYKPATLAYGSHTIYARAVAWDQHSGSFLHSADWTAISFTYQAPSNTPALITAIGNSIVEGKSLLAGQIISERELEGVVVQFDFDNNANTIEYSAVTDASGRFSIDPHGIAYGPVSFQVRTRQIAAQTGQLLESGWSTVALTFAAPPDAPASVSTLELANDTGASSTDKQTTDPTLVGTITNDGAVGSMLVHFYHDADEIADGFAGTDANGRFVYSPENLASGNHTIRARMKDYDRSGNVVLGDTLSISFILLDPSAGVTRVTSLELAADTGASSTDKSTDNAALTGQVANAAEGTTVEFDSNFDGKVDGTTTTDSNGNFSYTPANLSAGPLTVRARIGGTSEWSQATSITFVYSSTPDAAEYTTQAAAIATFTSGIWSARTTHETAVQSARSRYRSAIDTARAAYDASFAAATQQKNSTISTARETYQAILRAADATYASALASAGAQFATNLATFTANGGNTTSFKLKEFAFPDAPPDAAYELPSDGDQPTPPSKAPNYTGSGYGYGQDPQYEKALAQLEKTYQTKKIEAEETYNSAVGTSEQVKENAIKNAKSQFQKDVAAAEKAYATAINQGESGINLAEERRKYEAAAQKALQAKTRAHERNVTERLAKLVEIENKFTADKAAAHAGIAAAGSNAAAYELAQIALDEAHFAYALAKAEWTAKKDRQDADLELTYQQAIRPARLAYETKVAEHDQWVAEREANASYAKNVAIAEAAERRDKSIIIATHAQATTAAEAGKARDITVEQAANTLWVGTEQLKLAPVQAWDANQQTPWSEYQKKLVQNAIDYVVEFAPKLLQQFTTDAGSLNTEAKAVIDAQKKLADETATSRLVRATSDASALRTYQVTASIADRNRTFAIKAQENSVGLAITMPHEQAHLKADDHVQYETDKVTEGRRFSVEVHTLKASNYTSNLDPMTGVDPLNNENARRVAAIERDHLIRLVDVDREYYIDEVAKQQAQFDALANADAAMLTAKTTAYEAYQKAVATNAETFAKDYVRKYATFVTTASAAAKTADNDLAGHLKTLVTADAPLQGTWSQNDLSADNEFRTAAATEHKNKNQAWHSVVNTAWSTLQVALSQLEVDRVTELGSKLLQHLSSTAGVIVSAVSQAATQDETLTTQVSSGLDSETQDLADALIAYVDADASARATYQRNLATKTADHDKQEIAKNAAYLKTLEANRLEHWHESDYLSRFDREEAHILADYTYEVTFRNLLDEYQPDLNEGFNDENTEAISARDEAKAAANEIEDRRGHLAQVTHDRKNAEAKLNHVTEVGNLHVGLANQVKTLADTLATALKGATDSLSEDQAGAAKSLASALADAEKQYVTDSAQTQANSETQIAQIDGQLDIGLVELDGEQQVAIVQAHGDYEIALVAQHQTDVQGSAIWNGPIGAWKNLIAGASTDHLNWQTEFAEANVALKLAQTGAYVNYKTAEMGENGALLSKLSQMAQSAAQQAGSSASAAANLSKQTTDNLGKLAMDSTKASTKAVVDSVAAETKYDVIRAEAKRDYNIKLAEAELLRITRTGDAYMAWFDEEITQQERDAETADAAADEAEAQKEAKVEHAEQTVDGQIERAGKLGDALIQAAGSAGAAAQNFASAQADAENAFEEATTGHELTAVSSRGGADCDYNIRTAQNLATLIDELGAADEQYAIDLKPINVARAEESAERVATQHIAALTLTADDLAALAIGQPVHSQAAFDAVQASAELGWAIAMQPSYVTYAGSMAAAAADELIALAIAMRAANNSRASADLAYVTATEPINFQRGIDSTIAYRQHAEREARRRGAVNNLQAAANTPLAVDYATAAKDRAVAEATADRAYWSALYALPTGGNSAPITKTRDLAYADGDISRTTKERDADVTWTTAWAASQRTDRVGRASSEFTLFAEQSRIDRDSLLATSPHTQSRLTQKAAVQTAYWTAEVSAANSRRTAETAALATFLDADYANLVTAVASIDTAMDLPWTEYQVGLAGAKQDWWTDSERGLLVASTATANSAASTYQATVSEAFLTWIATTAGAESLLTQTQANERHSRELDNLDQQQRYERKLAYASEPWQVAMATARRNHDIAVVQNVRNRIDTGDTQAESTDNATAAATKMLAGKSADQQFTIAEVASAGLRRAGIMANEHERTTNTSATKLAYITATSIADRDYAIAEATARAAHFAALATSTADAAEQSAAALALELDNLATSEPSIWSEYDAALTEAVAEFVEIQAPALADFLVTRINAERDFATAIFTARQIARVQIETAASLYRQSESDADLIQSVSAVATENRVAALLEGSAIAPMRSQFAAAFTPSSIAGNPSAAKAANETQREEPPAPASPPVQPTSVPRPVSDGPSASGTIHLPLPARAAQDDDGFFARGPLSVPLASVLASNADALHGKQFGLHITPSVIHATPLPTPAAVAYWAGKPLQLPEGFEANPAWKPEDIQRMGQMLAVGQVAGPYTPEQVLAINAWTDLVKFEHAKVMNYGSYRDLLLSEIKSKLAHGMLDNTTTSAEFAAAMTGKYDQLAYDDLKAVMQSKLPPGMDVDEWLEKAHLAQQEEMASELGMGDQSSEAKALILDLVQMALDIGGIFEPTPFCDIGSAAISLYRLQVLDGLVSVVSVAPYVGDTAKFLKFPKYIGTVAGVGAIVAKNPKIGGTVLGLLQQAWDFVSKIDIPSLPQSVQRLLDDLLAAIKKAFGELDEVQQVAPNKTLGHRPTARQSELDVNVLNPNHRSQVSFKNGREVQYGKKGSVRPDNYRVGEALEVKNYNVADKSSRAKLYNTIHEQYLKRISNLPRGTHQKIIIDIRGQNVPDSLLRRIRNNILTITKSSNVTVEFLR